MTYPTRHPYLGTEPDHRRWKRELDQQPTYRPVWISDKALKSLTYTLGHCTTDDQLSLSEAIERLASDWIALSNFKLQADRNAKRKKKSKRGKKKPAPTGELERHPLVLKRLVDALAERQRALIEYTAGLDGQDTARSAPYNPQP